MSQHEKAPDRRLSTRAIRSVLVHVDATAAAAPRLEVARQIALRTGSTLHAMFVARPPQRPVQLAVSESPAALFQTVDWAAVRRAKEWFDDAAAKDGPPMRWLDSTGTDAVDAFMRQALYADLLVLGQHDANAAPGNPAPSGFVESALIDTARPALVVPNSGSVGADGRNVLIGWNATPQAAHAVTAALPWLRSARHVHVLAARDADGDPISDGLDIAQYLQLHGITASMHHGGSADADAGEALLSLATHVGADLLVMGCYGHSRVRELVLGGATRTVLDRMTLPVLMAH